MALSRSALSELLEAFRSGEGVEPDRGRGPAALQELIEVEATEVVRAGRYERIMERKTERNGSRPRRLTTTVGDVQLRIPKLRKVHNSRCTMHHTETRGLIKASLSEPRIVCSSWPWLA